MSIKLYLLRLTVFKKHSVLSTTGERASLCCKHEYYLFNSASLHLIYWCVSFGQPSVLPGNAGNISSFVTSTAVMVSVSWTRTRAEPDLTVYFSTCLLSCSDETNSSIINHKHPLTLFHVKTADNSSSSLLRTLFPADRSRARGDRREQTFVSEAAVKGCKTNCGHKDAAGNHQSGNFPSFTSNKLFLFNKM